jgi:hypothetical protein
MDSYIRNELMKRYIWSTALHGIENWIPRKVDEKYLKSSEVVLGKRSERSVGLIV